MTRKKDRRGNVEPGMGSVALKEFFKRWLDGESHFSLDSIMTKLGISPYFLEPFLVAIDNVRLKDRLQQILGKQDQAKVRELIEFVKKNNKTPYVNLRQMNPKLTYEIYLAAILDQAEPTKPSVIDIKAGKREEAIHQAIEKWLDNKGTFESLAAELGVSTAFLVGRAKMLEPELVNAKLQQNFSAISGAGVIRRFLRENKEEEEETSNMIHNESIHSQRVLNATREFLSDKRPLDVIANEKGISMTLIRRCAREVFPAQYRQFMSDRVKFMIDHHDLFKKMYDRRTHYQQPDGEHYDYSQMSVDFNLPQDAVYDYINDSNKRKYVIQEVLMLANQRPAITLKPDSEPKAAPEIKIIPENLSTEELSSIEAHLDENKKSIGYGFLMSDEELMEAVELISNGMDYDDIKKYFRGISVSKIREMLRERFPAKHSLLDANQRRRRIAEGNNQLENYQTIERIIELNSEQIAKDLKQGLREYDIAKKFNMGCTAATFKIAWDEFNQKSAPIEKDEPSTISDVAPATKTSEPVNEKNIEKEISMTVSESEKLGITNINAVTAAKSTTEDLVRKFNSVTAEFFEDYRKNLEDKCDAAIKKALNDQTRSGEKQIAILEEEIKNLKLQLEQASQIQAKPLQSAIPKGDPRLQKAYDSLASNAWPKFEDTLQSIEFQGSVMTARLILGERIKYDGE